MRGTYKHGMSFKAVEEIFDKAIYKIACFEETIQLIHLAKAHYLHGRDWSVSNVPPLYERMRGVITLLSLRMKVYGKDHI